MILSYRNTKSGLGEAGVTVRKTPDFNEARDLIGHTHVWSIRGLLTTQAESLSAARDDIKTKMAAIDAQYGTDGGDLIQYNPDGSTQTHHTLLNSDTRDGVRVVEGPNWDTGTGTELVTKATYTVVLEGYVEVSTNLLDTQLRSFSETLQFASAGRKYRHRETLRGRARRYQSRRHQVFKAVQRGSAVGLNDYPTVPSPIWPFAVTDEFPEVTFGTPKTVGDKQVDWPISWSWTFEHAFGIDGRPHRWKDTYQF